MDSGAHPGPEGNEPNPGFRPRLQDQAFRLLSVAVLLMLGVGTVVYHSLEDWSWVDSFYFCSVAVTTVGFGDLAPTGDASKLFTVVYVFTGIGIITTYVNERFRRLGDRRRRHRDREEPPQDR